VEISMSFTPGDRVELLNCSRGAAGSVVGFSRNRVLVTFDDMPLAKWLRAESLRLISTVEQVTR
jgi:hypothetical protein